MANKALSKRQKLAFRVEPSQKPLKARNPLSAPVKQRTVGSHGKSGSAHHRKMHAPKEILDPTGES